MSGKKSRLMRKLLNIKIHSPEFKQNNTIEQDTRTERLIIDGMKDETRIETYTNLQLMSNEERMQYRAVKKLYKNTDHELNSEIKKDLDNLKKSLHKARQNKLSTQKD